MKTLSARQYLSALKPVPPKDFAALYPSAGDDAIDLLKHMMRFLPEDRITAAEALSHRFFGTIRHLESEVCCLRDR